MWVTFPCQNFIVFPLIKSFFQKTLWKRYVWVNHFCVKKLQKWKDFGKDFEDFCDHDNWPLRKTFSFESGKIVQKKIKERYIMMKRTLFWKVNFSSDRWKKWIHKVSEMMEGVFLWNLKEVKVLILRTGQQEKRKFRTFKNEVKVWSVLNGTLRDNK